MQLNNVTNILTLALAVDCVLVIWFKGSIFTTPRSYFEAWSESDRYLKSMIGELFTCSICLPIHVTLWLYLAAYFIPQGDKLIAFLAASGLASRIYNYTVNSNRSDSM